MIQLLTSGWLAGYPVRHREQHALRQRKEDKKGYTLEGIGKGKKCIPIVEDCDTSRIRIKILVTL